MYCHLEGVGPGATVGGVDGQGEVDDVPSRGAAVHREIEVVAVNRRATTRDVRIRRIGVVEKTINVWTVLADGDIYVGGGLSAGVVETDVHLNGLTWIDDTVVVARALTTVVIVNDVTLVLQGTYIGGWRPTVRSVAVANVAGLDVGVSGLTGAEDHWWGDGIAGAIHQGVVEVAAVRPVVVHPGQDGMASVIGRHGDVGVASDGSGVAKCSGPGDAIVGTVQHSETHTSTPGDDDLTVGELHRVGEPATVTGGEVGRTLDGTANTIKHGVVDVAVAVPIPDE